MTPNDKKTASLLKSVDKSARLDGIAQAVDANRYRLLPDVIRLASVKDAEVAVPAVDGAVKLAKACLRDRTPKVPAALMATAVSTVRKFDPHFADRLLERVHDDDAEGLLEAIFALRHLLDETSARRLLSRLMGHPDNRVRATAVLHIGTIASKTYADVLTGYMNDGDNRVKANAIEVVEKLGNKALARILARFRKDRNNRIRANVLKALYALSREDIMPDLEVMLLHEEPLMRTSAVWVIGEVGAREPRYSRLLNLVVDDSFELLRDNVRIAIRKIGDVNDLAQVRRKVAEQDRQALREKIAGRSEVKVHTVERRDYLLVRVTGAIMARSMLSLKMRFEELAVHSGEIVLDLAGVDYIDSSGIALLLNLSKRMTANGHILYICHCSYTVNEVFQLSQLDKQLNIFQTEREIRDFTSG